MLGAFESTSATRMNMKRKVQINDLSASGAVLRPEALTLVTGGARRLPDRSYEPDVTYDGQQCRVDGWIEVDISA